jgi:hypothetical protein
MNAMSNEADIVEKARRSLDPFWHHTRDGVIIAMIAEVKQLRAERDDWRRVAECNDAFLQAAKEGHPVTIVPPDDARAASRDMRERCAKVAEDERQNSNHGQQRGDQAGFAELGFEAACELIAESIRALPDTPGDQQP